MSVRQWICGIRKRLVHAVPEPYREEFRIRVDQMNLARGRLTALAFLILEGLVCAATLILRQGTLSEAPQRYYLTMYAAMFLAMCVFLGIFRWLQRDVAGHGRAIGIGGVCFGGFILCWCAGISLLDQLNSGQIMVYIVAVMAVAVAPLYAPLTLALLYLPVHAAFLTLLILSRRGEGIPFGNVVNSSTIIIISWVISYMRYRGRMAEFADQKLIEEKNAELERVNAELQEANKRLEKLTQIDSLTGILNRTMFDRTIRLEWDRCRRQFLPLSLVMVDIDLFKSFNDHYGHQAGDSCIRQVAGALSACARRASDSVTRYGGEEFAVILPGVGEREAAALAETMRERVEALAIPHAASYVSGYVTISLGVCAVTPSHDLSLRNLIGNADKALYRAKDRHNSAVVFHREWGDSPQGTAKSG